MCDTIAEQSRYNITNENKGHGNYDDHYNNDHIWTYSKGEVNFSTYRAIVEGKEIKLTPTQVRLLKVLVKRKGIILDREFIKDQVWGIDSDIYERNIDSHISRLRKKSKLKYR